MPQLPGLQPASLQKLPPGTDMLLARGEWSWCAMEHSRIGSVELAELGSPFHHLALSLGSTPPRLTMQIDDRRRHARAAANDVTMIQAGAYGLSGWDSPMESACLYFTDEALGQALGLDAANVRHDVRTRIVHRSPKLARLIHALFLDASRAQPHGALIGDAIFLALAAMLAPAPSHRMRPTGELRRVTEALAFIHAHLTDDLSIGSIAQAAATSPYYLNRCFRVAVGCSIWKYVLRARANYAMRLLQHGHSSLAAVAQDAGFQTYPAFIAAFRQTFGQLPSAVRS